MQSKRLAIIVLGIALAGCHKRPGPTVALPPPTIVTVVVPVAVPVPVLMDIPASLPAPAGASLFGQAELAFVMGDYVAAIQDYENYLGSVPNGDHIDQVLFHLGMAYVFRTKPPANWARATASLKRLINEHPDSPLRPTANLILSLRSHADQLARDAKARNEILKQLNAELDRLKKIDAGRQKHLQRLD
jgi:TolA-binding protein